MDRLQAQYADLMSQTALGVMNHVGTLEEILGGYAGGYALQTKDGPIDMTVPAAKQLFAKVGLDVKTMKKFDKYPELQQQMALARLSETADADQPLIARGVEAYRGGGPAYQMFVPQDKVPVLNSQVLDAAMEVFPSSAMLHSGYIKDRQMFLRIVDEGWSHDLGPGGQALTAVIVENDERSPRTGLTIRTGISRVACWNTTLDHQPVFQHRGGLLRTDQLTKAMRDAMGRLGDVAGAIATRMNEFHDVGVDDVKEMLRLMSGEVGLPTYVTEASEQWWKDNGSIGTVFYVVQALTFGVQKMTARKNAQWARRAVAETQAFSMADEFVETGEIKLHECPRCHRPMAGYDAVDGEYSFED